MLLITKTVSSITFILLWLAQLISGQSIVRFYLCFESLGQFFLLCLRDNHFFDIDQFIIR